MIWIRRISLILLVVLIFVASAGALGLRHVLRSSLPREMEDLRVAGISAPVSISRDRLGTPVIKGQTFDDVCFGQGFIHGQERFFQMDLARRFAAGELSALIGPSMLNTDRAMRRHRFRHVAEQALESLPKARRTQLKQYARGVNAGLNDLKARPPEYLLLRTKPEPWTEIDSLLVVYTMFNSLNFDALYEEGRDVARRALAPELLAFLTPSVTRYDAPMIGPRSPGDTYTPAPIPGPEVIDLRAPDADSTIEGGIEMREETPGSNNWAVAGTRTAHGGAILADDMHLPLRVPGIWRHDELRWGDSFAVGASLPGVPGIVVGSNGSIAWGVTNVMADTQDLVVVEVDPEDATRYRTPDGWETFEESIETIDVRGMPAQETTLRSTRWGVVTGQDPDGQPTVMQWPALMPEIFNLRIIDLVFATSLEEGVEIGSDWVGPSQNMLIADDHGRIAWVVTGWLPQRVGFDGTVPVSWADGSKHWAGGQTTRPVIIDPADGMLFSANNRTAPPSMSDAIGQSWGMGFRAKRIEEMIEAGSELTEQDLFEMQLDTRAELMDFYRDLILERISADDPDAARRSARALVESWDGRAGVESVAFRFLRGFRIKLHQDIIMPLTASCQDVQRGFLFNWLNQEESVRRLIEEEPMHMLSPDYESWDDLIDSTYDWTIGAIEDIRRENEGDATWGARNQTRIQHPIAQGAPWLGWLLNMRDVPAPGSSSTVRVSRPGYGASQRLVVSPGKEKNAIFQLPTGVSGHPMSPHYGDRYEAWVKGAPQPLLSGEPVTSFQLLPSAVGP